MFALIYGTLCSNLRICRISGHMISGSFLSLMVGLICSYKDTFFSQFEIFSRISGFKYTFFSQFEIIEVAKGDLWHLWILRLTSSWIISDPSLNLIRLKWNLIGVRSLGYICTLHSVWCSTHTSITNRCHLTRKNHAEHENICIVQIIGVHGKTTWICTPKRFTDWPDR